MGTDTAEFSKNTEFTVANLTMDCIMRARVGTLLVEGTYTQGENPNETNDQGFVPDVGVREHICSSCRP